MSDETPECAGPSEDTSKYAALFRVTGTTPELRRMYRSLRKFGLCRYDANLVIAGVCLATDEGHAEIRRFRR